MRARRRAEEAANAPAVIPKPSWWRYLKAYVDVLDSDGRINVGAIAKKLGISTQAHWALHKRNPALGKWVSDQIERHTDELVGPVIRKMALVGLRGSVDHAKLFLQTRNRLQSDGAGQAPVFNVQIVGVPGRATEDGWKQITGPTAKTG